MEVEESSSEEEEAEDEVRSCLSRNKMQKTYRTPGVLHGRNCGSTPSQEVNSRVFPAEVGFPLYRPVGVIKHQVLTTFFAVTLVSELKDASPNSGLIAEYLWENSSTCGKRSLRMSRYVRLHTLLGTCD